MEPELDPEVLEAISDDLLDPLITEQAQEHFDSAFQALGQTLCILGHGNLYLAIEAQVNALCVKVAEAAFGAGHRHGYTYAVQDMIATLRPIAG